tara:strand:+ start:549 stop:830 length:282 start_codon:yes stop_codon:yes gene_type:complete
LEASDAAAPIAPASKIGQHHDPRSAGRETRTVKREAQTPTSFAARAVAVAEGVSVAGSRISDPDASEATSQVAHSSTSAGSREEGSARSVSRR